MDDESGPNKPIRVSTSLWRTFERYAGTRRRSHVLRDFMEWYTYQPGATLPKRPSREDIMARSADPLDNDPPTQRTEPLKNALDALDEDSAIDPPASVPANRQNMKLSRKSAKNK